MYVAVTDPDPEFTNVPIMEVPLPDTPPVKPVPDGADHEYTVPLGITFGAFELGVTEKAAELHVCVVMFAITGTGSTLTVNVKIDEH